MTTKICVVVGFVVALIYFEANGEMTTAAAPQSRISIHSIINFQTRVMIMLDEADSLNDYEAYFSGDLRREVRYILNRLRGFASDAAQADEWQRAARQFFQYHFISICVTQACEYAEVYSSHMRSPNNASRLCDSLKEICVRPAAERMTEMFNANFHAPQLADYVLHYEVIRFTRLPLVVVLTQSAAPVLRIRNGSCARYVEMANGGVTANFRPREYAPRENIINDLRHLNYALSTLSHRSVQEFSYTNRRLAEQDGELHKFLRTTLRDFVEEQTPNSRRNFERIGENIIEILIRELLARFLSSEFVWLSCHPAYPHNEKNSAEADIIRRNQALHASLLSNIVLVRSRLLRTHVNLLMALNDRLGDCLETGGYALRRVYELASTHATTPPSSATAAATRRPSSTKAPKGRRKMKPGSHF